MYTNKTALVAAIMCVMAVAVIPSAHANTLRYPYWSGPPSLAPRRHSLPAGTSSPLGLMNGVFSSPILFNSLLHLGNDLARAAEVGPRYQIVDSDDGFELELELPGIRSEDVKAELVDGGRVLQISGVRKHARGSDAETSSTATFEQRFVLDDKAIETSKISANLSDGLLVVKAPKRQIIEDDVKSIPITAERKTCTEKEVATGNNTSEDGKDSTSSSENIGMTITEDGEEWPVG